MLTLYTKPGCPYCAAVLEKLETAQIPFEEKSIAEEGVAEELVERGGKRQVPFLIDSEREVEMYESEDIIAYLETHYSKAHGEEGEGGA